MIRIWRVPIYIDAYIEITMDETSTVDEVIHEAHETIRGIKYVNADIGGVEVFVGDVTFNDIEVDEPPDGYEPDED